MAAVYMICWTTVFEPRVEMAMYDKVFRYIRTAEHVRSILQRDERDGDVRYIIKTLFVNTVPSDA